MFKAFTQIKYFLILMVTCLLFMTYSGFILSFSLFLAGSLVFFLKDSIIKHSIILFGFSLFLIWYMFQDLQYIFISYFCYLFFNLFLIQINNSKRIFILLFLFLFLICLPFVNLSWALDLRLFSLLMLTNLIPLVFSHLDPIKNSNFEYFVTCLSPWNLFFVYISPREFIEKRAKNSESLFKTQRNSLVMVVVLVVSTLFKNILIKWVVPDYSIFKNYSAFRFNFSSFELYPLTQLHLNFLTEFFLTGTIGLLKIIYVFGTGVFFAQVLGFDIFYFQGEIFKVDSLKQLILKIYYFYNRVLVKMFFIPLTKNNKIKLSKFELKILSILIGGIFFHIIRDFGYFTFYSNHRPAQFYEVCGSIFLWAIYNISLILLIKFDSEIRTQTWFPNAKFFFGSTYKIFNFIFITSLLYIAFWINFKIYLPVLGPK